MFGDILKSLRISYGLTQSQLGQKIKVSSSTIGMYEQNRRLPDYEMLCKFTEIFNVSTDYLLARINNQIPIQTNNSKHFDVININTLEGLLFMLRNRLKKERSKKISPNAN